MGHILQAKGIHKSYTMGKQTLTVLRGVEMSLSAGDFAVIVGASGSGKSTLLHILGALDKPDKGTIEFEGQRLDQMSNGRLNQFRNQNVGFVFQFYHLLDELNVLENVLLPAMIAAGPVGWLKCKKMCKTKPFPCWSGWDLKTVCRINPMNFPAANASGRPLPGH